jgi:outer membrane protein assembly factor BamA
MCREITVITLFFILLFGCKPTKYVPEDKYLVNKVKVDVDNKHIKYQDLKSYIRQKPNKRILSLRFHLGLYNLSNINKKTGMSKYLQSVGEAPVIWDQFATDRDIKQLKIFLMNKGYFDANVFDTLDFKDHKVDITFRVQANKPLIVRSIKYAFEDTSLQQYVLADTLNSQLKRGDIFDKYIIDNERIRIESLLRNNGYFYFSRDYVRYDVDSTSNLGDVTVNILNRVRTSDNQSLPFYKYRINQVTISTQPEQGFQQAKQLEKPLDSVLNNGIKFIYYKGFWVKPNIIQQSNYILPGTLYRIYDVEETRNHLSSLNVFGAPNIQFTRTSANDSSDVRLLDCLIQLSLSDSIQGFSWEVDGTNSSGNFGGALSLTYQHRSLFRNAENFNLKLRGATEAVRRTDISQYRNTLEYGVEASLKFPKFLLPFNSINFTKRYNPKTLFSTTYNYQRRPEYTYTVANMSFGYQWKGSKYVSHIVNPIEVNFVNLLDTTSKFNQEIKGTYLENMYNDHLVSVSNYSYIHNNQNIKKTSDFHIFRWNLESAGNLLNLINDWTGAKKTAEGYYQILGVRYSQYLKSDIEYRYFHIINESSKLAYRFFGGAAYPYGNAVAIPFEKRYFAGGANSIRGWQLKTLGPGSYLDTISKYPNSTGDIKLEANVEYRFKLFWILEGAMFVDAGNIWSITRKDERPGAIFEWNKFYNDIAIGSGLGIRFCLPYFLFRFDFGMKTLNPSYQYGKRWIINRKLNFHSHKGEPSDFAISFGINYPF